MKIKFSFIISIILCSLFILSCDNGTKTQKGIISGVIYLDGQTEYSGIIVSVFSADVVPIEIKNVNREYPQLPYPINDYVYFDHRAYNPIRTVYTDSEGKFEISDITYGNYIIAYYKEGWGYNYMYDIELNSPEYNMEELRLYPELEVPHSITNEYIFISDRTYRISGNCVSLLGSNIIAQTNTRLIIDPKAIFQINGNFITQREDNNMVIITSSNRIYNPNSQVINGLAIEFTANSSVSNLNNILFSYLYDGLKITKKNLIIENCGFIRNINSLQIFNVNNIEIRHNNFLINEDIQSETVYCYNTDQVVLERNIFYKNACSIKTEIGKNSIIQNNYFINGVYEIQTLWESTAIAQYNSFKDSKNALSNSGASNLEILYNEINSETCVNIFNTSNWENTFTQGWTKANNNNFMSTDYAVLCKAVYFYGGNPMPLDFHNNYWGVTNSDDIANMIYDYYDAPPHDTSHGGNWGIIEYIPFKTSPVTNAGVQLNNTSLIIKPLKTPISQKKFSH
ncbi:hypothetical protein [Candidatus Cloacimonas acidaminovorans]|uniref:Periplasmic copper-binding protein NosD beta helix domain-containing protein n=1 Tax=Cloacimonas acidaminovorans (strain Evry) TaxID=459349 RepID=B0VGV8_CLOAI|nr:hypothetical protein [Candidatus Cloacimonas acidaminovorans]CAO80567.1 hypothetical protein; putative signal peptide [Candidatus Cloacimonas acidaminovorans str. Evry]